MDDTGVPIIVHEARGAPSTWGGVLGAADVLTACHTSHLQLTQRAVPLLRARADMLAHQLMSNATSIWVPGDAPLSAQHIWLALLLEPSLGWLAQRFGFAVPVGSGAAAAAAAAAVPPHGSDKLHAPNAGGRDASVPASKRRRVVATTDPLGRPPLPPVMPTGDGNAVMWVRTPRPCIHPRLLERRDGCRCRADCGFHPALLECLEQPSRSRASLLRPPSRSTVWGRTSRTVETVKSGRI